METPNALYDAISKRVANAAHEDPPGDLASSLPYAHQLVLQDCNIQAMVQGLRMFASLSKRGNFDVCQAALPFLEHPSHLARQHAATALSKAADVGDQAIIERLVPLLGAQEETSREAAIEAISEIGDDTTVQVMLSCLRPGPDQRTFTHQASSLQVLEKLASQGDEQVLEVVHSKLTLGTAEHVALSAFTFKQQVPVLEESGRVRAAAFHALAMLADPSDFAVATVHELLTKEKVPAVRAAAVRALGNMSETDHFIALDTLCPIAQDNGEDVQVREAALNALARIASKGNKQAKQAAIASLGAPHSSLRDLASEVLLQLVDRGDRGAVDALLERISSKKADCHVQAGVLLALSQLASVGDHRVVEAAHYVMRGGDATEARKAALRTLVAIAKGRDQFRTVQAACYLANSNDAEIVQQALESLSLLCPSVNKELATPVTTALFCMSNEHPEVRVAACDCIAAIAPRGKSKVNQELAGLLRDDSSLVRLAAVQALVQLRTLQDNELLKALDVCHSATRTSQAEFEKMVDRTVDLALEEYGDRSVISQICCTIV